MYRKILTLLAAVGLSAGIAACGSAASQLTQAGGFSLSPAAGSASTTASATGHAAPASAKVPSSDASLQLLTEPAAGIGPIYQLITGAHSSVDLTMYELVDTTAESDLAADAARGVNVRVLLDQHLEKSRNEDAYSYLTAHKVHVQWAPSGTTYHQKTLTVDNATSAIMTLNLVSEDYPDTRDFAVIDTDSADVAAIVSTFNADFAGQNIAPPDGADLVWSPTNAQASIMSVIGKATHTLALEDEEMDDPTITSALASAAKRGVDVTVTMTDDSEWDSAFAQLTQAGVHVHTYADNSGTLYIHAKAIIADAGRFRRADGARIPELLRGKPHPEPGTRHPHYRQGPDNVRQLHPGQGLRRRPSPTASSASSTSSSPKASGAECTATATVYNASKDENDVTVHSNQPDKDATATAAGHSKTYKTDSSGYALIYLNGPPPGSRITVTVGGATCATSD